MKPTAQQIAAIVVMIVLAGIILLTRATARTVSLSVLVAACVVLLAIPPAVYETFLFETSPAKQHCLSGSSDSSDSGDSSTECCKKGTVGGSLPVYREWLEKPWHRTDSLTLDPKDPMLQSQLVPTELV
jgi:hypothetical protein